MPPEILLTIMEHYTTDSMLALAEVSPIFKKLLHNPRLWIDVDTEEKYPKADFINMLVKYSKNIVTLKCQFQHELLWVAHLNEIIQLMSNLVSLNLSNCSVFYWAGVLQYTPKLVYLNVSNCPWMSTKSLIDGMQLLPQLKEFLCDGNSVRFSAYTIWQCVEETKKLQSLSCMQSGNMVPWLANRILSRCPELHVFHFSSDFDYDYEIMKLRWYNLMRKRFPQVEYSNDAISALEFSEKTCPRVIGQIIYDNLVPHHSDSDDDL